jgi:plasmid stabilization system protein ParE
MLTPSGRRLGLGIEFVLELDAAIERAAESPKMYALRYREARRVLLRRFPYAVYFVYEGEVLEVFAILHQQQEPAVWQTEYRSAV